MALDKRVPSLPQCPNEKRSPQSFLVWLLPLSGPSLSIALSHPEFTGGSNSINPMQEAHLPRVGSYQHRLERAPLSTSLCPAFLQTVSAFFTLLGESMNAVPTTTNYANYVGGPLSGSVSAGTFSAHTQQHMRVRSPNPSSAARMPLHCLFLGLSLWAPGGQSPGLTLSSPAPSSLGVFSPCLFSYGFV